jgi:cytochrome b involved in lipid metabolism
MTSRVLLWQDFCACMSLYGPQLFVLTCLSAMTIYRREMSCNRVFHQPVLEVEEEEVFDEYFNEDDEKKNHLLEAVRETETEELLDGAGMYYSGAPLLTMASIWVSCFGRDEDDDGDEEEEHQQLHKRDETTKKEKALWKEDVTPTDLLDRVGNYYSGEPLWAVVQLLLWSPAIPPPVPISFSRSSSGTSSCSMSSCGTVEDQLCLQYQTQEEQQLQQQGPFSQRLPPDVHVQIASFLHPKDLVAMSCVSKSFHEVVDQGETAAAIWKTLWRRDYAWIIYAWDVGQRALQRSQSLSSKEDVEAVVYDKDFYFQFGQAYLDYILAGQNTANRCLVSLHSNIYDITDFSDLHPGSPDTLMVHSGRDATAFFEDMGHSLGARRVAKRLCVVVDASSSCSTHESLCGLHPTLHTRLDFSPTAAAGAAAMDIPLPSIIDCNEVLMGRKAQQQQRRRRRPGGTLRRIRKQYVLERERILKSVNKEYASISTHGHANPFYDPFCQQWQCWYTDSNFQTVFVSDVVGDGGGRDTSQRPRGGTEMLH